MHILIFPALCCIAALLAAKTLATSVSRAREGTERMREIASFIREGAVAFMVEEAKVLSLTVVAIAFLLWWLFYWQVALSFAIGAFLSGLAAFIGMDTATRANVRTAHAASHGFRRALDVAFSGGAVMGLSVGGLALGGLCLVIFLFRDWFTPENVYIVDHSIPLVSKWLGRDVNFIKAALIVSAYSMGASLVALFDRVGGGIYTKAADMSADLVGKVEAKIPEDDPRNPATIADNVGDNVGDVGGLGADLLESFVGAIISAIVILLYIFAGRENAPIIELMKKFDVTVTEENIFSLLFLPICICAGGILSCLIGILYTKYCRIEDPQRRLMAGTKLSAFLTALTTFIITYLGPTNLVPFWCVAIGVAAGVLIGFISEYFTSSHYKPVQRIAKACQTGPAVTITTGLAVGMESTLWPVLTLAVATISAYQLGGLLGVTFAAFGMLSFVVMTVSVDTYGPIADNAGGIAQMSHLDPKIRGITDRLDAVGNTTAAIGKGFAIGSAAFAAFGLICAYLWSAASRAEEIVQPTVEMFSPHLHIGAFVVAGLFIGAMVPYIFSALLIKSVGETAEVMIAEIRRQFREHPGILEGKEKPDYAKCITITSASALKKMVLPALIAIFLPLLIGFVLGRYALAGLLMGALLSSMQLAVKCGNAGGALDNAKKYIEEGHYGGKGSEAHAAGVIGDTFGDPLKDTVGPSLDILVKLMSVVALLFASLFPIRPFFF